MRYFRPAIITLIIAVVCIFGLLFYISIRDGKPLLAKETYDDGVEGTHFTQENKKESKKSKAEIKTESKTEAKKEEVTTKPAETTTESAKDNTVEQPSTILDNPINMVVTADSLRIRTKPDTTNGEVLAYLNTGNEVQKYGESGDWTYIKYGESYGWVSSQYLKTK